MNLSPYTDLIDKHTGQTAFICGAGPSFYDCYNHPDFNMIFSHVVIAVNTAYIAIEQNEENPDRKYWVSNDALVRLWSYYNRVRKSNINKVIRSSWDRYYHEFDDPTYFFWPRPTSEDIVNPEDTGLAYCSSIPTSLDLAIKMGCSNVYLLGVDQYMLEDGKSHFWQLWDKEEQPYRIDRRIASYEEQTNAFSYNDLAYPALKKFADSKGVKVYNCSINSNVEVFAKITPGEAF